MSQQCEVCGKKVVLGNQITTRGKAKYLGGVGTKVTGIARRQFRPNLQRVRITTSNGTHKRIRVCTQCLRSGAVTRVIRVAPFKLPAVQSQEAETPVVTAPEKPPARASQEKKASAKKEKKS